jgi:nucleoid-associated protein YejK
VYGEGNENYIMNFATANSFVIDPNFKIDNTTFKRLITIRAKVKGIELNVDYEKLNEQEVDVDIEQGIIIIRSAELAKQINDQKQ